MTIDELKTGMVVQLRDGWRGLVLRDCSFYYTFNKGEEYLLGTDNDYMSLSDFKNDLTCDNSNNNLDIMFVYQPYSPYDVMDVLTDTDNGTETHDCIFNREWEERNKK